MSIPERPSSGVSSRPPLADAALPGAGKTCTSARRALVYDDDDAFAEECAEALGRHGFAVETRAGRTGFAALLSEFAPHLVLLDLHMPEFDGVEALRVLRDYGCKDRIELILVTAADRSLVTGASTLALTYGLRLRGALRKPFRLSQLVSLIAGSGDDKIAQF